MALESCSAGSSPIYSVITNYRKQSDVTPFPGASPASLSLLKAWRPSVVLLL